MPLKDRLRLALDITKYRDTDLFAGLGVEYLHPFSDGVSAALRAGYNSHRSANDGLNEISFGAGINFHRGTFDLAWIPFGDLGSTFRYSLLIRF